MRGRPPQQAARTNGRPPEEEARDQSNLLTRLVARRRVGSSSAASRPPTSTSATRTTSARPCPRLWLLSSLYFRGEVRGLGNIPEDGPVLLVGNHSGGNLTPDTTVFTLAFCAYFGVERPFYQLAHNLVLSMPGLALPAQVRHGGGLAGQRPEGAAVRRRAARLPGRRLRGPPAHAGSATGSTSTAARASSAWRSSTTSRSSRSSRSAARRPRCSSAAASRLARLLGLDRAVPAEGPADLAGAALGANIGDMLGHIPLPAKITIEALPPIHLREEFGAEPDLDEVYDHVIRAHAGHPRRAGRRAPPAGARMRVAESIEVSAPPEAVWERHLRPRRATCTSCRGSPAGRSCQRRADRPRRALPDAHARRLGRGRRPDRGRRVGAEPATWPGRRVTGIDQRGRWRLRERRARTAPHVGRAAPDLRRGRRRASSAGSPSEFAAPTVRGHLRRSLQQLKRQVEHEELRARAAARRRARAAASP